jgi:hypothetical protein
MCDALVLNQHGDNATIFGYVQQYNVDRICE